MAIFAMWLQVGTKCWAAYFPADTPPALLCLNAEIEIAESQRSAADSFARFLHRRLGENYRRLQTNELVTRVFLPAESAGYRGIYRKLRVRGSIDYPLAGVAVVMKRSNGRRRRDARIGNDRSESRAGAGTTSGRDADREDR